MADQARGGSGLLQAMFARQSHPYAGGTPVGNKRAARICSRSARRCASAPAARARGRPPGPRRLAGGGARARARRAPEWWRWRSANPVGGAPGGVLRRGGGRGGAQRAYRSPHLRIRGPVHRLGRSGGRESAAAQLPVVVSRPPRSGSRSLWTGHQRRGRPARGPVVADRGGGLRDVRGPVRHQAPAAHRRADRQAGPAGPVDGLGNRRAFDETLAVEIARSRRDSTPLSIGIADLDDLKGINDRLGHLEGDRCLSEAARAIELSVRMTDRCYRWGGDEFVIVLPSSDGWWPRRCSGAWRWRWPRSARPRTAAR